MNIRIPAIVILLGVAVLQASVGGMAAIYGIRPSLTVVAVYALALIGGEGRGIFYGAVGGLAEDCLSGGLMGVFMSGYALVGFLAGRTGKRVFNIGETANFTGLLLLSIVQGVYTAVLMNTFLEGYDFWGGLLRFAVPQALYSAAAGTLVLWLFKKEIASRVPWLKTIRHIKVQL